VTDPEKRAYQRGYYAGSSGRWPEHRPPLPPGEVLAPILQAARALRDGVDGELAKFGPDDDLATVLGPLVDALDAALAGLSRWLKSGDHP
jgi:hypothetical protein